MRIQIKSLAAAVSILALLTGVSPLWAADGLDGTPMALDALVLRPLGIISTVVGAGVLVLSLPFSAPTGSVDEAADALVAEPFRFTFQRPLGEDTAYEAMNAGW